MPRHRAHFGATLSEAELRRYGLLAEHTGAVNEVTSQSAEQSRQTGPAALRTAGEEMWIDTGREGVRYKPIPRDKSQPQAHALSIDLEDWSQSVFDHSLPLSGRFVAATERILEMLDRHRVRATFFVLGLAAKKAPPLIRALHQAGHEVQTHGYDHTEITRQSPEQFREGPCDGPSRSS